MPPGFRSSGSEPPAAIGSVLEGPSGPIVDVALAAIRHARETCLEPIVGP